MTTQQKLEALVQKAVDGGFSFNKILGLSEDVDIEWWVEDEDPSNPFIVCRDRSLGELSWLVEMSKESLIFNHDFAKALWGKERISTFPWAEDGNFKYETKLEAWMHHLQQMVIADNPIDYAYNSVFGEA